MNKKLIKAGLVAAVAGAAGAANAAVDVSAVTAAGTDIALVGAAVFTVYVGVKVFQWIRKAL